MVSHYGGINNSQINYRVFQVTYSVEVETFTDICEDFIASSLRVEAQSFYRECGHRENLRSHSLEESEIKMEGKNIWAEQERNNFKMDNITEREIA
jgi:hypothetical protein